MKLILERLNKEKGIDEGRQKLLNLATRVENFPQGIVSSDRILLESVQITGFPEILSVYFSNYS